MQLSEEYEVNHKVYHEKKVEGRSQAGKDVKSTIPIQDAHFLQSITHSEIVLKTKHILVITTFTKFVETC
jgi:hypothetical protein